MACRPLVFFPPIRSQATESSPIHRSTSRRRPDTNTSLHVNDKPQQPQRHESINKSLLSPVVLNSSSSSSAQNSSKVRQRKAHTKGIPLNTDGVEARLTKDGGVDIDAGRATNGLDDGDSDGEGEEVNADHYERESALSSPSPVRSAGKTSYSVSQKKPPPALGTTKASAESHAPSSLSAVAAAGIISRAKVPILSVRPFTRSLQVTAMSPAIGDPQAFVPFQLRLWSDRFLEELKGLGSRANACELLTQRVLEVRRTKLKQMVSTDRSPSRPNKYPSNRRQQAGAGAINLSEIVSLGHTQALTNAAVGLLAVHFAPLLDDPLPYHAAAQRRDECSLPINSGSISSKSIDDRRGMGLRVASGGYPCFPSIMFSEAMQIIWDHVYIDSTPLREVLSCAAAGVTSGEKREVTVDTGFDERDAYARAKPTVSMRSVIGTPVNTSGIDGIVNNLNSIRRAADGNKSVTVNTPSRALPPSIGHAATPPRPNTSDSFKTPRRPVFDRNTIVGSSNRDRRFSESTTLLVAVSPCPSLPSPFANTNAVNNSRHNEHVRAATARSSPSHSPRRPPPQGGSARREDVLGAPPAPPRGFACLAALPPAPPSPPPLPTLDNSLTRRCGENPIISSAPRQSPRQSSSSNAASPRLFINTQQQDQLSSKSRWSDAIIGPLISKTFFEEVLAFAPRYALERRRAEHFAVIKKCEQSVVDRAVGYWKKSHLRSVFLVWRGYVKERSTYRDKSRRLYDRSNARAIISAALTNWQTRCRKVHLANILKRNVMLTDAIQSAKIENTNITADYERVKGNVQRRQARLDELQRQKTCLIEPSEEKSQQTDRLIEAHYATRRRWTEITEILFGDVHVVPKSVSDWRGAHVAISVVEDSADVRRKIRKNRNKLNPEAMLALARALQPHSFKCAWDSDFIEASFRKCNSEGDENRTEISRNGEDDTPRRSSKDESGGDIWGDEGSLESGGSDSPLSQSRRGVHGQRRIGKPDEGGNGRDGDIANNTGLLHLSGTLSSMTLLTVPSLIVLSRSQRFGAETDNENNSSRAYSEKEKGSFRLGDSLKGSPSAVLSEAAALAAATEINTDVSLTNAEKAALACLLYRQVTAWSMQQPASAVDMLRGDQLRLVLQATFMLSFAAGGYCSVFKSSIAADSSMGMTRVPFVSVVASLPSPIATSCPTEEAQLLMDDWRQGMSLLGAEGIVSGGKHQQQDSAPTIDVLHHVRSINTVAASAISVGNRVQSQKESEQLYDRFAQLSLFADEDTKVGEGQKTTEGDQPHSSSPHMCEPVLPRELVESTILKVANPEDAPLVHLLYPSEGIRSFSDWGQYIGEVAEVEGVDPTVLIRQMDEAFEVTPAVEFQLQLGAHECRSILREYAGPIDALFETYSVRSPNTKAHQRLSSIVGGGSDAASAMLMLQRRRRRRMSSVNEAARTSTPRPSAHKNSNTYTRNHITDNTNKEDEEAVMEMPLPLFRLALRRIEAQYVKNTVGSKMEARIEDDARNKAKSANNKDAILITNNAQTENGCGGGDDEPFTPDYSPAEKYSISASLPYIFTPEEESRLFSQCCVEYVPLTTATTTAASRGGDILRNTTSSNGLSLRGFTMALAVLSVHYTPSPFVILADKLRDFLETVFA